MGHLGEPGHPKVREAILTAIDRLNAIGKPAGLLSLDPDFARTAVARGARFVAIGLDMALLVNAADGLARAFRA
jgi:4-hydroxy-2-oxoheptanedioate aldolase